MNKIYIIGEIGINHNGELGLAKQLIDMAKECGCDAVKFQKRNVEKVIPKEMWNIKKETPFGIVNYIDYKKGLELDEINYIEIDKYCKQKDIDWFASAWDKDSLKFINSFNIKYNKIASPMMKDLDFVREVAKYKKKTLISTGMCTIKEIKKVVDIFKEENCEFVLMHCVSIYPCPDELLNLNAIDTLVKEFNLEEIGYSGHAVGVLDAIVAAMKGATYIEKHITLDRSLFGSDQSASLEKQGLQYVVRDIRLLPIIMGTGDKSKLSEKELKVKEKLYGRNIK